MGDVPTEKKNLIKKPQFQDICTAIQRQPVTRDGAPPTEVGSYETLSRTGLSDNDGDVLR